MKKMYFKYFIKAQFIVTFKAFKLKCLRKRVLQILLKSFLEKNPVTALPGELFTPFTYSENNVEENRGLLDKFNHRLKL